jgi:hypothetical protein
VTRMIYLGTDAMIQANEMQAFTPADLESLIDALNLAEKYYDLSGRVVVRRLRQKVVAAQERSAT